MGNHNSHDTRDGEGFGIRGGSRRSSSIKSATKEEPEVKVPLPKPVSMVPIEKLAKMLVQHSHKEEGVKDGITENTFVKYVFPLFPELGRRVFGHLRRDARPPRPPRPLTAQQFSHSCELLLSLLDDMQIIDTYVRMFCSEPEEGSTMSRACFLQLLCSAHQVALVGEPQEEHTLDIISKDLECCAQGCFSSSSSLKVGCVVRWLGEHLRRILLPLHRFVVSSISLAGVVGAGCPPPPPPAAPRPPLGPPPLGPHYSRGEAWLVAAAAPRIYSTPPPPPRGHGVSWSGGVSPPVSWTALYLSSQHGLGANRFLHHTLAYRGPTLVVVQAGPVKVCVCAPREWRDSALYWGGPHAALLQILPGFSVILVGGNILYLNTLARGLPKGLLVAADPREPVLQINQDFDTLSFQGEDYPLTHIEVWGCGDQASRETQLDIKKWQVQECERQNQVKLSAADWLEHPDRYLLQLAGRAQYNDSNGS